MNFHKLYTPLSSKWISKQRITNIAEVSIFFLHLKGNHYLNFIQEKLVLLILNFIQMDLYSMCSNENCNNFKIL